MLAAGLQDWVDFGVICVLLLLNAAVGFIQEFQAGSIVDELKKTLALQAICLRNGKLGELAAPELVPGDIIQVEEVCFRFLGCNFDELTNNMVYREASYLRMAALLPMMLISKLINQHSRASH